MKWKESETLLVVFIAGNNLILLKSAEAWASTSSREQYMAVSLIFLFWSS